MKPTTFLLLLVFVLMLLIGCSNDINGNSFEDIRAIETMSAARADAFNEGDAASIANHFTEDGVLMAPSTPAKTGRNAVESYYQFIFDEFKTSLVSHYEEVRVSGNLALGRGVAEVELTPHDGGETINSTSKYINILERQADGSWLTTHDIWNDN
ncbi:hypothetical protein BH23BAC3_BH23BAC3_29470 [soil metagenome]